MPKILALKESLFTRVLLHNFLDHSFHIMSRNNWSIGLEIVTVATLLKAVNGQVALSVS